MSTSAHSIAHTLPTDRLPAIHITLNGRGAYLVRQADLAEWCASVRGSEVA